MNKIKILLGKTKEKFKKHPKIYSIAIIVIVILIIIFTRGGNKAEKITVTKGTIIESVQASGKTKPAEDVKLGFDRGGRIAKVYAKVGDTVKAGQILVALDQGELSANLLKAKADLASETSKLEELLQGSGVGGIKTSNTQIALRDARANLVEKIRDSYTKSDDAIRNYAGQFFNGAQPSFSFKDYFVSSGVTVYLNVDYDLKASILQKRTALSSVLSSWSASMISLNQDSNLETYLSEAKTNLNAVRSFLDELSIAVNKFEVQNTEFRATINGFKSDVSTARANVNTAIANLLDSEERYNSASLDTNVSAQTISAQENRVLSSRANVQAIEAQINQAIVTAPFDGVVTKSDVDQGEIVSAGTNVVSLISEKNLLIESNVSEVNIGKVNVGNSVKITLDAFPLDQFVGKVNYIEPAETIVDNVVTYKVTIVLNDEYESLKSGLTANLNIETARKDDVMVIPQFAIVSKDGKDYVKRLIDGESREIEVKLGAKSSDGMVQVIEGLSEGDILEVESSTS